MKQEAEIPSGWRLPDPDSFTKPEAKIETAKESGAPPPDLWEDEEKAVMDFDFGRFFRAFWIRKWLILFLGSAVFAVAALVILSIPPVYRAAAQILIDPADSVIEIQSVSSPLSTTNQGIASEIEVIRSNGMARQLIEAVDFHSYADAPIPPTKLDSLLGLEPGIAERSRRLLKIAAGWLASEADAGQASEEAVVRAYYSALGVWRVAPTFVISIAFDTKDPDFSVRAANELAAIYITNQIEQKRQARIQASQLLTENLSKLDERIQGSKKVVSSFRRESGLSDSISSELLNQQLSEQMTQLVNARASQQTAGARLAEVERLIRDQKNEELLSVINSTSARAQWDALRAAERQLAVYAQDYGPNHPIIIQQTQELQGLSQNFEREIQTAVQALRSEAGVASDKVTELQRAILDLRQSMTEVTEKENELRQLEADADISRTLHETLTNRIREAESAIVEGPDARILNLAERPLTPHSMPKRFLLLGAFIGAFAFSGVVALGLEFLNGGYQTEEELRRSLGWPILATVPKHSRWSFLPRSMSKRRASAYEEAFNALYTNLEFHGLELNSGRAMTILITSSVPGEGKSTVVHGLARTAVENGAKVLVIDADLRRSTLHKKFDAENKLGLANCDPRFFDEKLVKNLIVSDPKTGVDIIPAGAIQTSPQQLLRSSVPQQILRANRPHYDLIVIDTPPILAVADAQLISKHCDSAVLVIKWSSTSRRLVQRAIARVSTRGMPLAGCVLTQVAKSAHRVGTYQYLDYT
ncbi:MAG: polysaccharide biosynthesis tyrosine autokinase [Alphaproteobacteria bacterium]|nr:polysaccharide biosynthesis tyrosine autokinase [Alphaproteobacteria bacterium]